MAAQANNLTIFNIVLAIAAILGLLGWGWFVKDRAEKMAKASAEAWMNQNAPSEIARINAAMSSGGDETPEEQAEALANDVVEKEKE